MKNSKLKTAMASLTMMIPLLVLTAKTYAQQSSPPDLIAVKSALNTKSAGDLKLTSAPVLDTVRCMFHQVTNSRSTLSWRRGYIVLENDKILMGNVTYPTVTASQLTGLLQNKFLANNRKKVVKNQVVQVVLLQ